MEHTFRTEEISRFHIFIEGRSQSRQGTHFDVLSEKHVQEAHDARMALKIRGRPPRMSSRHPGIVAIALQSSSQFIGEVEIGQAVSFPIPLVEPVTMITRPV
jgi:hypothetical protein